MRRGASKRARRPLDGKAVRKVSCEGGLRPAVMRGGLLRQVRPLKKVVGRGQRPQRCRRST